LEVDQRPPEPLLLGRHLLELGVEPGPLMGEITRAIYEMQLDGRVRNLDQAIEEAKRLLNHG
jgi:tRNA nucleotidyltransferase (CCA-adding enzyme)